PQRRRRPRVPAVARLLALLVEHKAAQAKALGDAVLDLVALLVLPVGQPLAESILEAREDAQKLEHVLHPVLAAAQPMSPDPCRDRILLTVVVAVVHRHRVTPRIEGDPARQSGSSSARSAAARRR